MNTRQTQCGSLIKHCWVTTFGPTSGDNPLRTCRHCDLKQEEVTTRTWVEVLEAPQPMPPGVTE